MATTRAELATPAVVLAPRLLGAVLLSEVDGRTVRARITEVEAYEGSLDPASHAYRGPTRRTEVMFGPPGHLYCYFVYGMHWCANVTCQPDGTAGAVLIRAAQLIEGVDVARVRSAASTPDLKLASGPARLARCLGLNGQHSGLDLLDPTSPVRLERMGDAREHRVGPRVGIAVATEHPWRFWLADEPSVSTYRPGRTRVRRNRHTGQP